MWGAIAAAAASAANSAYQAWSDHQNRKATKSLNDQMIELANTAHQREVADLKAAGINPILSAGGSGASTPTLTAPSYNSQIGTDALNSANSVYNSYRQGQLASAQVTSAKTANELQKKELIKQDYSISSAKSQALRDKASVISDKLKIQAWKDMTPAEKQQVIKDIGTAIKFDAVRSAMGASGNSGNGSSVSGLSDTAARLTQWWRHTVDWLDGTVKKMNAEDLSKKMKKKLEEENDKKYKVDVDIPKPKKAPVDYKPKMNPNDYYRYTSPRNGPVYRP